MKTTYIEPLKIYFDEECTIFRNGKPIKKWIQKRAFLNYHHYPDWMSLKLHLTIEALLEKHTKFIPNKLYHFLHGLICGYKLNEILQFIGWS